MAKIVARNIYDPYVAPFDGAPGAGIDFSKDKGKTVQSDTDGADINKIMDRFIKKGIIPEMRDGGLYDDFSSMPDFQDALNVVNRASEQFNALDASIRNRFANDPAKFLEFAVNPDNQEEMIKLGIAKRKPASKRKRVRPEWKPTPEKMMPSDSDFLEEYLRPDWQATEQMPWPLDVDYSVQYKPA